MLDFDVLNNCGENAVPGVQRKLRLVCACDVLSPFPTVVGGPTQGGKVRIVDDILLAPGARFIDLDLIEDTGNGKNTGKGQRGSRVFDQMVSGKTTRGEAFAEFYQENINGCMIGIITEKTGKNRIIGHPEKGTAYFGTVEEVIGENSEAESVWSFELFASPGFPMPYYEGAIDVTP